MKKNYIDPQVIVMPCFGVSALCGSGETQEGLGKGNGLNPWDNGRAPRRTEVF